MEVIRSTAHGDKLRALLANRKLPGADRVRVERTIDLYETWKRTLASAEGPPDKILQTMVEALSAYKHSVEVELIFDAQEDFLYRQKGQLKLDNTVLEEFIPYLFDVRLVPGLARIPNLSAGPHSSFAGLSFASPFLPLNQGGVSMKLKDQDFAVARSHRISISNDPSSGAFYDRKIYVTHFASEIKTNLDKTMFQEASQTAAELKRAVPGSRYILLCEYLDMTPIATNLTSIDEVIVLRKAKRMGSNLRAEFSTVAGRARHRDAYIAYRTKNALRVECFNRFLQHLNECFPEKEDDAEDVVLERGYF